MKVAYYFTGTDEDLINLHFIKDKLNRFWFLPTSYYDNGLKVEPIKVSIKTKKISCPNESLLVFFSGFYKMKYKEK